MKKVHPFNIACAMCTTVFVTSGIVFGITSLIAIGIVMAVGITAK